MYPLPEGGEKKQWLSLTLVCGFGVAIILLYLLYQTESGNVHWDFGQTILNFIKK